MNQFTRYSSELTDTVLAMMTLQQVRYFLVLCDEQSFSRAAKHCGIAQPSLTLAIKQLEAELGGQLIDRGPRISHMSGLAMVVRPHLVTMVRAANDAKDEAAAFLAANGGPRLSLNQNGKPRKTTLRGGTVREMQQSSTASGGNLLYAGYPYDPYA